MMVLEYEGAIVVIDVGLRFPTAEMVGIDLVLPDFSYLRDRVDDIEGIVVTHGHEDHLGALPWVLRELSPEIPVFGGPLTTGDGASKLDEHRLREVEVTDVKDGEKLELGPVRRRADPHDALDPRRLGVAVTCDVGTTLVTGDYKFDQTPSTGSPPTSGASRSSARGLLLLCGDSTNADRAGASLRARRSSGRAWRRSSCGSTGGSW
jgi:ribonuclease J